MVLQVQDLRMENDDCGRVDIESLVNLAGSKLEFHGWNMVEVHRNL